MRIPVLTAAANAVWEGELVAALDSGDLGVEVIRRCVDLADLLAAATAGTARAVVLSADLRGLDREVVALLASGRVAVVGLAPTGDGDAERRLHRLGVPTVLAADAAPDEIAAAVVESVVLGTARPQAVATLPPPAPQQDSAAQRARGRLVAVWGPTGAPGRTTVAVALAAETARAGTSALLVDADVYGGVVAQVLGLLDEAPGLAAAVRLANAGRLDESDLAALAGEVRPGLRLLTGSARADRWPELRPAGLEAVLDAARRLAALTVVDCGFCLERDEELSYDTAAPRRNGATLAVLTAADTVVAVGTADPVGLHRLVRGLSELRDALPDVVPLVVVNRLRRGPVPGRASQEVRAALDRHAGVPVRVLVPFDPGALDAAAAGGRTLDEVAPSSPARRALMTLAAELTGAGIAAAPRRRLARLRR